MVLSPPYKRGEILGFMRRGFYRRSNRALPLQNWFVLFLLYYFIIMYAFCCKQRLLIRNGFVLNSIISANFDLGFVEKTRISLLLPAKYFSSERKSKSPTEEIDKKQHSFIVSYLIESCGLSPETAISASTFVNFESSKRPDSVLSLLRDYGFENAQISKVISKAPKLLVADPKKTLMPKLEFFHSSVGLSGSELPKFICSRPRLLECSLKNQVIVIYDFLKGLIVGHDTKVAAVLSLYCRVPGSYVQRNIIPNIEFLRGLGMPQSKIVSLASLYPSVLSQKTEIFGAKVKEVIDMGFNPSKSTFVKALLAVTQMSKSTWQHKIEVYKRLGWSDDDVDLAFRKNPVCLCMSERKIVNGMDFLVNKMGVKSRDIARSPIILNFSLQKRIIPRCLLVRFLQLKGLLKKDVHMLGYLKLSEELFLDKFVTKYQEQVPQLPHLYPGKVELLALDVRTEDINWQTLL